MFPYSNFTRPERMDPSNQVRQCGLATAARPDEGHALFALDIQRFDPQLKGGVGIAEFEIAYIDQIPTMAP